MDLQNDHEESEMSNPAPEDIETVARAIYGDKHGEGKYDAHHRAGLWHQEARVHAESALHALTAAGRLLPAPTETRTEWGVWWYGPIGDGIRLTQDRFSSRQAAEEHAPTRIGDYGITRYQIHRREHRIYADHSSWSGAWVPADGAQQ